MDTPSRRPPGPKSSLRSHSFPSFYACYLLKSIQTPLSKATYIGSTPNPPRRIRQHNGEITQGAWKTKSKRPWVMHMIVHGFPSKLAALQFEWAWQHPHLSRHLRDAAGKQLFGGRTSKSLKLNIHIVRAMISSHPYSAWPLHVKLFTDDAVNGWREATKDVKYFPLPPGFTCSTELEGVDGKSGKVGSGRQGPISVKDESFTSAYLMKNTILFSTPRQLKCTVCDGALENYTADALTTVLCPESTCSAASHMTCLSKKFLDAQSEGTGLVPRGGTCTSCHTYTLWGDIVRGCYRRNAGEAVCEPDDEGVQENNEGADFGLDNEQNKTFFAPAPPSTRKKATKSKLDTATPKPRKPRQKKIQPTAQLSSEGEFFDLNVSSTDEGKQSDPPLPTKKRGRVRIDPLPQTHTNNAMAGPSVLVPLKKPKSNTRSQPKETKSRRRPAQSRQVQSSDSGEFFDFGAISEDDSDAGVVVQHPRKNRGGPSSARKLVPPVFSLESKDHRCADMPPAEASLTYTMSSLYVSSPITSPKHAPRPTKVIELSD